MENKITQFSDPNYFRSHADQVKKKEEISIFGLRLESNLAANTTHATSTFIFDIFEA